MVANAKRPKESHKPIPDHCPLGRFPGSRNNFRFAPPIRSFRGKLQSLNAGLRSRNPHGSVRRSLTIFVYCYLVSKLGPTLDDLYVEIGRTLVIWGWLEGEMIDAKINWRQTPPEAATEPLRAFLLGLAEPRGIRNAIAHGLASSHSDPWSPEFEPYVTCRTLDADLRKITLSDLRRTQVQLELLRKQLRKIYVLSIPAESRRT